MAPWHWPYRGVYLVGFLVCILLLGYAWYAEPLSSIEACSLCLVQVTAFSWMGLWYLLGGLHTPHDSRRWVYMTLVMLGALTGLAAAIQHALGPEMPTLQSQVCRAGDCARATWRFLGLSMSAWAAVWYVLLTAFAIHGAVHPYSPRQLARMRATQTSRE